MKINLITVFAPRLDFYHIEDWIKHNLNLGVDHIYFYNNGFNLASDPEAFSNKESSFAKQIFGDKGCSGEISKRWDLKPHVDHFLEWTEEEINSILEEINDKYPNVTFIPFEYNVDHSFKYPLSQFKAMRHHIDQKIYSDWIAMLDIDEYINLGKHCNLKDFINYVSAKGNYDNISLPQIVQRRIYRESFTINPNHNSKMLAEPRDVKTFCKTSILVPLCEGAVKSEWFGDDLAWSHHNGCIWTPTHKVTTYLCDKTWDMPMAAPEAYYNHYKSERLGDEHKILCCILHTENQPERYKAIEQTWGKRIDHMYYSDHDDPDKNIVKVSEYNDYRSCVDKNARVFNILLEDNRYNNYDYYLFVDNDTYVNEVKLNSVVRKNYFDKDSIHGDIVNYNAHLGAPVIAHGGAGYLMHKSVVEKMKKCPLYQDVKWSDMNISLYAIDRGIEIKDHKGFNSCNGTYDAAKRNGITFLEQLENWFPNANDHFTFHKINTVDKAKSIENRIWAGYK